MPQAEPTTRIKVLATIGVMLALLLAALDQTIVGQRCPASSPSSTVSSYSWLITGLSRCSTASFPLAGKLGDLFGRKPFLIGGMIGFVAASALCGVAQDMTQLIVFRSPGVSSAHALRVGVHRAWRHLHTAERVRSRASSVPCFGLSSIIGPVVGGFLTGQPRWRWVFYVNLPVGLLGVAVVAAFLALRPHKASWRDIDFVGSAALAAGLIPVLVALSVRRTRDGPRSRSSACSASAWPCLFAFSSSSSGSKNRFVPFQLFKNRAFAVSMLVAFFAAVGMFG